MRGLPVNGASLHATLTRSATSCMPIAPHQSAAHSNMLQGNFHDLVACVRVHDVTRPRDQTCVDNPSLQVPIAGEPPSHDDNIKRALHTREGLDLRPDLVPLAPIRNSGRHSLKLPRVHLTIEGERDSELLLIDKPDEAPAMEVRASNVGCHPHHGSSPGRRSVVVRTAGHGSLVMSKEMSSEVISMALTEMLVNMRFVA